MKNWKVSILVLLVSVKPALACLDYPRNEDMRFKLLDPQVFGFRNYDPFFYTSLFYYPAVSGSESVASGQPGVGDRMNIALWKKRCRNIPSDAAIYNAVYGDVVEHDNPFIRYLYLHHDTAAMHYLDFARAATTIGGRVMDPWEREEDTPQARANTAIYAINMAKATRDEELRRRYAFQAIRISYYDGESLMVDSVYKMFFAGRKPKDIIDYWAMHFRAMAEKESALGNYYSALVFVNAPDKRFAIWSNYHRNIPVRSTLAYAKTRKERAAVWLMEGLRRPGRALGCMRQLHEIDPQNEGLDFLLLREVNKLEDWIYTPYYTQFEPAVNVTGSENAYSSQQKMDNRIRRDREYAAQVLDFVKANHASGKRKVLWETAAAYLAFMMQSYQEASQRMTALSDGFQGKPALAEQLRNLKALFLVAAQDSGKAIIPDVVKPVLLEQWSKDNRHFVFAVAKELEYRGNSTEAALLMSIVNPDQIDYDSEIYWKPRSRRKDYYDFYTDYFTYINLCYTPEQVQQLITAVETNVPGDVFGKWEYTKLKKQVPRLYDLLGTKYMRLNRLKNALHAFEKVNDTLWTSQYLSFHDYLDANPFYANMYSGHSKTVGDTIRYDKEGIVRTLLQYLARAENVKNRDRDLCYFYVANCYFNMSHYGNSWMMKRYFWGSTDYSIDLPDGADFFGCERAKYYYLRAGSVAKNKKFAALCLRMAGRCESFRLSIKTLSYSYAGEAGGADKIFHANRYYRELKQKYPDYYDDLISNCYSFDTYFAAGR